MTEDIIVRLFKDKGLGPVILPITSVSGGFMHRMYRVDTKDRSYAVKHLNPVIMKRPESMNNFKRAESLETVLEEAGIPIVPAVMIDGSKMQEYDGNYFYIFRWQNGKMSDWHDISAAQCCMAGSIQGRIHAIAPKQITKTEPVYSSVDWDKYIEEAAGKDSETGALLMENRELLVFAQDELNKALSALPGIECITDEDMDPKNVMWYDGKPVVIDLENLDHGNPVSSALQLSLQWSGVTVCDLDFDKLKAFFDGYLEAYDNGFRDYGSVFGLAYTWIEWLEYNINRALGQCSDETEREMGITQVKYTVARIRYIYDMEARIKRHFDLWFK